MRVISRIDLRGSVEDPRALLPRAELDVAAVLEKVRPICEDVRHRGTAALIDCAERFDGVTVVVTHFAPSRGSIAPRFAGSPLNACFIADLEALVARSGAALWIHGHTHDSFDYRLGGTRIFANPRGYVLNGKAENPRFDPGLTVEVG